MSANTGWDVRAFPMPSRRTSADAAATQAAEIEGFLNQTQHYQLAKIVAKPDGSVLVVGRRYG